MRPALLRHVLAVLLTLSGPVWGPGEGVPGRPTPPAQERPELDLDDRGGAPESPVGPTVAATDRNPERVRTVPSTGTPDLEFQR